MAGVFQTVHLSWHGEEYEITPTMKVLNTIENSVSLSRLAHRLATGDPPLSQLACVVGVLLREAGAKVDDDEVYAELMTGEVDAVQQMAGAVMMAVFPQTGKAEAPKTPQKKASPRK